MIKRRFDKERNSEYACMSDPAWTRVARYDKARRRSVWVRVTPKRIEFRAGREGMDEYAAISLNGSTTLQEFAELVGLFRAYEWAREIDGVEIIRPPCAWCGCRCGGVGKP